MNYIGAQGSRGLSLVGFAPAPSDAMIHTGKRRDRGGMGDSPTLLGKFLLSPMSAKCRSSTTHLLQALYAHWQEDKEREREIFKLFCTSEAHRSL